MKTLFLFTITIILALHLNARENPFETNPEYEEAVRVNGLNEAELVESIQENQYIQEMQNKDSNNLKPKNENHTPNVVNKTVAEQKINEAPKTYSKKEVDTLLQKTKHQTEQKTKEIVKKELANAPASEPAQVVYVKPRTDVAEDENLLSKKLLPFLKLDFNDNKLVIHTEHTVYKKFSVDKENKLIIDYKATVEFNTKNDNLESKNFKRVSVGNHRKDGYFRVAIELLDKPNKFDVDYKDNIITITRKN